MELDTKCSPKMKEYLSNLHNSTVSLYKVAEKAKKKGLDPEKKVPVHLATSVGEKVEGLMSSLVSELKGSGLSKRLKELEKKYGPGDWRVALKIAEEVAEGKFCSFESKKEEIVTGIRTGLAYITQGIVSAPLEGIIDGKLKERKDGKKYLAIYYGGPIRGAGGTGQSVSVLIADYVRKKRGIARYDPTEEEIKRYHTEVTDYYERVERKQYKPTEREMEFLIKNIPIEINGDPSSRMEVSNHKHLDRVETDRIRSGVALLLTDGLPLKAGKLWKQISKWGKDFDLNWEWLSDFLELKSKVRDKTEDNEEEEEEEENKVKPNYYFISEIVAGRPVFSYPIHPNGFRVRYGRSRLTGHGAWGIPPATMVLLRDYIGIGTQLRIERPGKSTALTPCDTVEGPIVKLKNGTVKQVNDVDKAKKLVDDVDEILFMGDMLISHGDFAEQGEKLAPPGYCEEFWALEVEEKVEDLSKLAQKVDISSDKLKELLNNPIQEDITAEQALKISKNLDVPLHPEYTYRWRVLSEEDFENLLKYLEKLNGNKLPKQDEKKLLEDIGVSHKVEDKIVFSKDDATILNYIVNNIEEVKGKNGLECLSSLPIEIRDKIGLTIGGRMGRPEKAKLRKLKGSPQVLFPVGKQGGRLRSFQSALEKGEVRSEFPIRECPECNRAKIYPYCEECGSETKECRICPTCKKKTKKEKCHKETIPYQKRKIDIEYYLEKAKERLGLRRLPELIKGVRGTSNETRTPENLAKGILRSRNDLYINKDGTVRFDMTELPATHFRPKEIGLSLEKAKELGYEKDAKGNPLTDENQVVELKPQDVILPEKAGITLFKVAKFVDEELEKFYDLDRFYNIKHPNDLIGHLILGIAPHTSAGIIGRILGFSDSHVILAHPYWHDAQRRDCLSFNSFVPVYDGEEWEIKKIGEKVNELNPKVKADKFGTLSERVDNYKTVGLNKRSNGFEPVPLHDFTKHTPNKSMLEIETEAGELKTTSDHTFFVFEDGELIEKKGKDLQKGDKLVKPYKINIPSKSKEELNLLELFENEEKVMIRGISNYLSNLFEDEKPKDIREKYNLKKYQFNNYFDRDSFPITLVKKSLKDHGKDWEDLPLSELTLGIARDTANLPLRIPLNSEVLEILGLYIADGYSRKKDGEFYQVAISSVGEEVREKIKRVFKKYFNLSPSCEQINITFSSKILYKLFVDKLELGKKARSKRLPSEFLDLELDSLKHLLRGYFEGDGSVSKTDCRVTADSVSKGLLADLAFVLARFGIFTKTYSYKKKPGPAVRKHYVDHDKEIPTFEVTKITIPSDFCHKFSEINFISKKKRKIFKYILTKKINGTKIENDKEVIYPKIKNISESQPEETYCLSSETGNFLANNFLVHNCDGEETSVILALDGLLNFSRKYLPSKRGGTMDAPLVLSTVINPEEIDDEVFDVDTCWDYSLEFYRAAMNYEKPWSVEIEQIRNRIGKPEQYEGFGYTHEVGNVNSGVSASSYKTIPTMPEKMEVQMELANKIRAVDPGDVAGLIIQKHFIRDIKGNLGKFTRQEFRCVKCNTKYRRPPLSGVCTNCGGKIVFTISEGTIKKYLEPSLKLTEDENVPKYIKQSLEIAKDRIEGVFGKEKTKQLDLKGFGGK